jgi:hypothetical protein
MQAPRVRGSVTHSSLQHYIASRPGRTLPPGKGPLVHCTGGWVGPRAGLDTKASRKSFASAGDRTPVAWSYSLVRHYTELAHLLQN